MNLGISKTVTCHDSLEEALACYDKAMEIVPDFSDAPDDDIRIHMVFCLTYKLLAYDLYKSKDIAGIFKTYSDFEKLIEGGNPVLYGKMWGPQADFDFHIKLLYRLMKIYVIFAYGQVGFKGENETEEIGGTIKNWLKEEFIQEKSEGNINPMIFTFYHKLRKLEGEISENEYEDILFMEYQKISSKIYSQDEKISFIYPEMAFPNDGDPVDSQFAKLLDGMKLFNWAFSYVYILLPEFYNTVKEKKIRMAVTQEILLYHEQAPYAAKGFQTDDFIIGMVNTLAESLETIEEFMSFVQSIFVHRETTSSIHFSMVSNLFGMCLSHMIERKPELFITKEYPDAESVRKNRSKLLQFVRNTGMLHDIGKIGITNLINLHFRKITDKEFQKIQNHTVLGAQIASKISYLKPYQDMILGHHKWHDGIGGYPKEFDTKKSEYGVFIDLLTLCDCLDTATDFKGRNYACKKAFDDILQEFKADDGTHYNKELIEIIDEDEALKDELRYMTTTGRNYTSSETYQKFIMPNTTFCEEDEKSVVEYTDEYKEELMDFYKATYPSAEQEKIEQFIKEQTCNYNNGTWIITDKKKCIFGVLSGVFRTPLAENQSQHFFITELVIRPEYRRQGLGLELVTEIEKILCSKGIHSIKIDVTNDFGLESFIWIAGFSKTKTYLMEKVL